MGKQLVAREARAIEVSDGVRAVMAGLEPAERAAVERALASDRALLRLPVELVVEAESGAMYTARVTDGQRLVYRLTPRTAEVVLLLSAGAVEYLTRPNVAPAR